MGIWFIQDHITITFQQKNKSYDLLIRHNSGHHMLDHDTTHLSNVIIEDIQKNLKDMQKKWTNPIHLVTTNVDVHKI